MKVRVSIKGERGGIAKRAGRRKDGFFVKRKGILRFLSKSNPRLNERQPICKKRLRKN
jgi:ribosomal protein L36